VLGGAAQVRSACRQMSRQSPPPANEKHRSKRPGRHVTSSTTPGFDTGTFWYLATQSEPYSATVYGRVSKTKRRRKPKLVAGVTGVPIFSSKGQLSR